MNPISANPVIGRASITSDASPVPSDLAGLFAMMFAATTAAPPPLQPTPVVLTVAPAMADAAAVSVDAMPLSPEGTPCAEGEVPPTLPGGWPGREASGLPAFPGLATTGRPRLERPGLTPALEDLTPVRRDLGPVGRDLAGFDASPVAAKPFMTQAQPASVETVALPMPTGLPVPAEHAPVLAAAIAAALPQPARANGTAKFTPGQSGPPVPTVEGKASEGEPLLADAAGDGGRGVRRRPGAVPSPAADAAAPAGSGRRKGAARVTNAPQRPTHPAQDGFAPAASTSSETAAPAVTVAPPPQAQGAGVLAPQVRMPDVPATTGAAPAGPVELPPEPAQTANPSHATVSFDSGDGQEGRLRVSLRGDTLRATIQMPDAVAAQRLEQDLGTLTRALRTHGFESARLTIEAPRSASNSERAHDDSPPREHKNLRDERSHSGDRNSARRERGSTRQER